MRDAIHAFKYDGIHALSRRLGEMLACAIATLAAESPAEMLLVPVPLHRARHGQRGFNQARLLAERAIATLRTTHPDWCLTLAPRTLLRIRATESQAGLTPHQRRINVRGAFRVSDPRAVRDRHILIIDDIFTTGATARATAKALIDAGAASVRVATLSRARLANPFHASASLPDSAFIAADSFDPRELPGDAPTQTPQPASMYSSGNQSS
jgi:ComF family protein